VRDAVQCSDVWLDLLNYLGCTLSSCDGQSIDMHAKLGLCNAARSECGRSSPAGRASRLAGSEHGEDETLRYQVEIKPLLWEYLPSDASELERPSPTAWDALEESSYALREWTARGPFPGAEHRGM
jgi:hypothetical protein